MLAPAHGMAVVSLHRCRGSAVVNGFPVLYLGFADTHVGLADGNLPSIVEENNVYGLQLKRNPSITTVLENDVETTVIFEITDNFGHTHKISALTFTIKKDANPAN